MNLPDRMKDVKNSVYCFVSSMFSAVRGKVRGVDGFDKVGTEYCNSLIVLRLTTRIITE